MRLGTSVPQCEQFLLMTPLHYKHGEPMKPELYFDFDSPLSRLDWWLWRNPWYRTLRTVNIYALQNPRWLIREQMGWFFALEQPWMGWRWGVLNALQSHHSSPWSENDIPF